MATFAKTPRAFYNFDAIKYVEFDCSEAVCLVVHWTDGQKLFIRENEALELMELLDRATEYVDDSELSPD